MGIPTLISTHTASGVSSVDITSGIDSTYDEYMFVFTDISSSGDGYNFQFQVNADGESDFDETITSTSFRAQHDEDDSPASLDYVTGTDQAQGTTYQIISESTGSGADECMAGILHLFSPASTTYVKHFYARTQNYTYTNISKDSFTSGYINTTAAIDEISFAIQSAATFSGTIQMYGIA